MIFQRTAKAIKISRYLTEELYFDENTCSLISYMGSIEAYDAKYGRTYENSFNITTGYNMDSRPSREAFKEHYFPLTKNNIVIFQVLKNCCFPIIVSICFGYVYLLFIDKLLFIKPSIDIITNFKYFCQWYLKIYILGIILLGFWILEPLFLKTKMDEITLGSSLIIGTIMLPITKII